MLIFGLGIATQRPFLLLMNFTKVEFKNEILCNLATNIPLVASKGSTFSFTLTR